MNTYRNSLFAAVAILALGFGANVAVADNSGGVPSCDASGGHSNAPACRDAAGDIVIPNPFPDGTGGPAVDSQTVSGSTVQGKVTVGGLGLGGNFIGRDLNVTQDVVGNNMGLDLGHPYASVDGATTQLVVNSTVKGSVYVGGALFGGNFVTRDVNIDNTVVGNNLNGDAQGNLESDQVVESSSVVGKTAVGGFFLGGNHVGRNLNVDQVVVGNNYNFTFTGGGEATVDQITTNSLVSSTVSVGGLGLAGNSVGRNVGINNTAVGNNANFSVDLN